MKALIPWIVGVVLVAIAGAVLFGGPIVGFVRGQLAKARAGEEQQTDRAVAGALTVEGERNIGQAAADARSDAATYRGAAYALERQTRADPTLSSPLPADEIARSREHDRSLCADNRLRCDGPPAPGGPDGG